MRLCLALTIVWVMYKVGGAGENRTHDRGFADLGLTTWLPRPVQQALKRKALASAGLQETLERETGFEPATSTLARSHSTTELLPLVASFYSTRPLHANSEAMVAIRRNPPGIKKNPRPAPIPDFTPRSHSPPSFRGWRIGRRNLIPDLPQVLIKQAFHSLLQNFDGRPHRAHHPPSNHAFGEFEMMETKELHPFVKIQQPFRHIVQAKEVFPTPVEFCHGDARRS